MSSRLLSYMAAGIGPETAEGIYTELDREERRKREAGKNMGCNFIAGDILENTVPYKCFPIRTTAWVRKTEDDANGGRTLHAVFFYHSGTGTDRHDVVVKEQDFNKFKKVGFSESCPAPLAGTLR